MTTPLLNKMYAQVLTAGIRLRNEYVYEAVEQPDGSIREERVGVNKINATPGQIIDVTGWHNVQAYVERGQILLLTNEQAKAHEASLPAQVSEEAPASSTSDQDSVPTGDDTSGSQSPSAASDTDSAPEQPETPSKPVQGNSGANRGRRR